MLTELSPDCEVLGCTSDLCRLNCYAIITLLAHCNPRFLVTSKTHKSLVDLYIVDDDPALRDLLNKVAQRMGFEPILCGNGLEFMEQIKNSDIPAICFIDIHMDQMDGIETIQHLASIDRRTTIRFITGTPGANVDSANVIADAKNFQVRPTLYKPFSMVEFQNALAADFAKISA